MTRCRRRSRRSADNVAAGEEEAHQDREQAAARSTARGPGSRNTRRRVRFGRSCPRRRCRDRVVCTQRAARRPPKWRYCRVRTRHRINQVQHEPPRQRLASPGGRIELPTDSLRVKPDPTQCHQRISPGHEPAGHDAVQPNELLSPEQDRWPPRRHVVQDGNRRSWKPSGFPKMVDGTRWAGDLASTTPVCSEDSTSVT